jgi:hypothetical protein
MIAVLALAACGFVADDALGAEQTQVRAPEPAAGALATGSVGGPPTDVTLKAAYCLEVVERQIAEIDAQTSDPGFKKGLREAGDSGEFSYITAMYSAKKAQYRDRRSHLAAYLRKQTPDKNLVLPLKALADADVKSRNFEHLGDCEDLGWLR